MRVRRTRCRPEAIFRLKYKHPEAFMIDHTGVIVSNFARSRDWYAAALAPLGYQVRTEYEHDGAAIAGLGALDMDVADFWISVATPQRGVNRPPIHIAFRAASRAEVHAFHEAGLAAGGADNGPPGLRPHYHPNYYAAFILDPDGHNIEAVCHALA
jgi:catechol 2,3-dioxygenase-like lactoylglutathione lyase family enzyme